MLSPELNLLFEQQSLFRNRDLFWDFAIGVRAERALMHNRDSYSSGGPITAYDDARLGLDVREELHRIEDSFSPKIWAVDPPAKKKHNPVLNFLRNVACIFVVIVGLVGVTRMAIDAFHYLNPPVPAGASSSKNPPEFPGA